MTTGSASSVKKRKVAAKEYLRQAYHISEKIKRLRKRRDDLRRDMYSIGSPSGNMDADKVQTSVSWDNMLREISQIDYIERDIAKELARMEDAKQRIIEQIEALDDERYKSVLFERYILFSDFEEIAESMGYKLKWIFELHKQALVTFAIRWKLGE